MAPDIIERLKASDCLLLLPFKRARSESINADSLNSNFLQLGRRSVGRRPATADCLPQSVTGVNMWYTLL